MSCAGMKANPTLSKANPMNITHTISLSPLEDSVVDQSKTQLYLYVLTASRTIYT